MGEVITYDRANAFQRWLRRLGASAPGSRVFALVLHHLDRPVHRLTRGRHDLTTLLTGLPVVMLTTTGAQTGRARTVPLVGLPMNGDIVVIASNFGQHRHPAWYYNLRANPDAELVIDGRRRKVHASEVEGQRRAEIWQRALRVYPGYTQYERRAAHRHIRVLVLEPR